MRYFVFIVFMLMLPISIFSQERMLMTSQYVHNQYFINPAFAGSRETLSLFGSYRQQWVNSPNPPTSMNFSAHAPLKNERIALGLYVYDESYTVFKNTRATVSYTYRLFTGTGSKIALSLNAGFSTANYGRLDIYHIDPDEVFEEEFETDNKPVLGFGAAWYGNNFFAGFSVYDFFSREPFDYTKSLFALGKSSYLLTGGYLFDINNKLKLQPSMLLKFGKDIATLADFSASAIIGDMVWAGGTYRTNKEIAVMFGFQIFPQLKITYSYDLPTGELKKFNVGSHEVSLQFNFGYKIITESPKFF